MLDWFIDRFAEGQITGGEWVLVIYASGLVLFLAVYFIAKIVSFIARAVRNAVARVLASPFCYPYFEEQFDVSGKRNVAIEDCIDRFLIEEANRMLLVRHKETIRRWEQEQETYLLTCSLQELRRRQFEEAKNDAHAYRFQTVRDQTRYSQCNYVKCAYKVQVVDEELAVSWEWLSKRDKALQAIGYEATLRDYHSKSQRRLMTPKLREKIKERDNFTCQICGKAMPDGVGLHIDHIVPVSKGGKTVESNLQVLCSKCNGSKSDKL